MHKIDDPTATPSQEFTDGDVQAGTPPTTVLADWLNAVQGELVAVVEAAGITLDKGDNTQLLQALGVASGGGAGLKNMLINGGFAMWPLGTAFSGIGLASTLTAARWRVFGDTAAGTGTIDVNRVVPTNGVAQLGIAGTPEDQNAMAYLELRGIFSGGADNAGPTLEQRAEVLRSTSRREVAFSIYLSTLGNVFSGNLRLVQDFGSGGSASVVAATKAISFGSTWHRYELAVEMPHVAGKTIGAGAHVRCQYQNDPGQVDQTSEVIRCALAQLEWGLNATAYDYRPQAIEELLAARYWETSYPDGSKPGTAVTAGEAGCYTLAGTQPIGLGTRFRVRKRSIPAMTWYDPTDGSANKIAWGGAHPSVTSPGSAVSADATGFPSITPSQPAGGVLAHWVADAEL